MPSIVQTSASESTVAANPITIGSGVSSTVTLTVLDASGNPIAGIPAAQCVLAVTGSTNTVTQPTGVTNADGVIAGSFSSTTAEAKTASFTVAGLAITQTAAVTVTGSAGDLTPEFFSDWTTALGTSDNAKGDGGKWGTVGEGGEVIAATGLGFPAGIVNTFKVTWYPVTGGGGFLHKSGMDVPAIGEVRYYRFYQRIDIPNGVADGQTHPVQDGFAGSNTNWLFSVRHNLGGDGFWTPELYAGNAMQAYPNNNWVGPTLDKGVVYRNEIQFSRTGTTTYKLAIRIYSSDGLTLVADSDDFLNDAAVPLSTYMASNDFSSPSNIPNLDGLNAGVQDSGATGEDGTYAHQAGFAVCDNQGWIGAYGTVTGEA